MNQLKPKPASENWFCSPNELIGATGSARALTHPMTRNGNGSSTAVISEPGIAPSKRPARGNGNGETSLESNGAQSVQRIEQSIAYMREHLNQPLPVAKLAALAHISPSHFFALFKRRTGSSPMDYFTHLRMQHACRLLDATSASVKEVAAVLGYDDPFYFSRVFKAVNRIPPSRYRASQEQLSPVLRPDKIGTADGGRGTNGNGVAAVSWPGNGKNQKSRIVHSL